MLHRLTGSRVKIWEALSQRIREVPRLDNATYIHTLVSESIHLWVLSMTRVQTWVWSCFGFGFTKPKLLRLKLQLPKVKALASASCFSKSFGFTSVSWRQASYPCLPEYEHRLGLKVNYTVLRHLSGSLWDCLLIFDCREVYERSLCNPLLYQSSIN